MKEADLYPPLKAFLETQGYEVKGEIGNCDVMAVRDTKAPVVVELKLRLNLDVILQAVDRISVTSSVYIGIPVKTAGFKRKRRQVIKLLRMLGLGLLEIDPASAVGAVNVVLDPGPYTPRQSKARRDRLLGEFASRIGDPNAGGADKRKGLMTAYRQKALAIARFLRDRGPARASGIAGALQEPKSRDILYRNVYGWFDRVSYGVYGLSPRGEREILLWPESCESDPSSG